MIETENVHDSKYPRISIDKNGNAIAVWTQWNGITYDIWANKYSSGAGWRTSELIEQSSSGDAMYPEIAMDGNGRAIAVWNEQNSSVSYIWANTYK